MQSDNAPSETKAQLVDRIEKVAARGVTTLTDWERNFLGSLRDSTKKWGRLTAKQHDTFQRIESKTDPANIAARNIWNNGFGDGMREKLKFAAEYYKANPPYFSDAADRILGDDDYIPTEKLYRKMVENKYVQRAMENANQEVKYAIGTMALVRNSTNVPYNLMNYRGKLVMIVECDQNVRSATKGARGLTVLPVGSIETIVTQERYLKKAKL
tara:strand:- start:23 stop:661 length:639 start_codon:yes stop_codon:yes gene_type:complete